MGKLRTRRSTVARIVLWILLGLALRTASLAGDGLWMDEAYTVWTAGLPWREHVQAVRDDDAPPLYYEIQRLILPHLPPGEASARALSVAASAATMAWLVAAPPIRGWVEAPLAFYALGTHGIYYGRHARSYAVLFFFSFVLMTATARVLEGRRRWLGIVALAEACLLYTHSVAPGIVIAANLAWLLCGRRQVRGWLLAQAAAFLVWLPYLVLVVPDQLAIHTSLNVWLHAYWRKVPLALGPFESLAAFTSGARVWPLAPAERWYYWKWGSAPLSILALASTAALLIGAFLPRARAALAMRPGEPPPPLRRPALFAAIFTLAPLFSLALASSLTVPAYSVGRADAIGYAGFVLWTSLGLRGLPRRWRWLPVAILATSTLLAIATRSPMFGHRRENDRKIAETIAPLLRDGDWLVFVGPSRPSIDYYLSGGRPARPDPRYVKLHFPAVTAGNPASEYPVPIDSLRAWEAEAQRVRREFEDGAGPADRRLFVVGPIEREKPRRPSAQDLLYPGNLLVYTLCGLGPIDPIVRLPGDEVFCDWMVFAVRRDALIPWEDLQPARTEESTGDRSAAGGGAP